jgi:hypothetical protein
MDETLFLNEKHIPCFKRRKHDGTSSLRYFFFVNFSKILHLVEFYVQSSSTIDEESSMFHIPLFFLGILSSTTVGMFD